MTKYPPVDPDFYVIGANSGLSDDEIQKDWEAFCDDLSKFHTELDETQHENAPALPERDTVAELKDLIKGLDDKDTFQKPGTMSATDYIESKYGYPES